VFSFIFAQLTFTMAADLVRPYFQYQETEAQILDRRFYLKSSSSTDSSGRSTTRTYNVPIVAARYNALGRETVSIGPASDAFFRNTQLGEVVPAWYDPDNPEAFTVAREFSVMTIIAICLSALITLALIWVAFRKTHEAADARTA